MRVCPADHCLLLRNGRASGRVHGQLFELSGVADAPRRKRAPGRSHCDACGHVLGVRDLVPVLSYVCSGGKCRYCGAKLSARHVWGELAGGAMFVSALLKYDISLQVLEAWLLACVLLACAFADLEGYIIPDRFLLFGAGVFIVFLMWEPEPLHRLIQGALGGLAVPGALLAVVLMMEKRMAGRPWAAAI